MKQCSVCGSSATDDAEICPGCGHRFFSVTNLLMDAGGFVIAFVLLTLLALWFLKPAPGSPIHHQPSAARSTIIAKVPQVTCVFAPMMV